MAHIGELGEALEAVFTTQPADHWVEVLRAANVPVGPINDVAEAYAMAEELGLEPILEADGVPLARPAGRLAAPAAAAARRARRRHPGVAQGPIPEALNSSEGATAVVTTQ